MVNERERDAVSDIIIIVDSRAVLRQVQCQEMHWFTLLEQQRLLQNIFSRRDSVGVIVYGDEVVSVDRDTGKKQLYVILTKLAGAVAEETFLSKL